LPTPLTAYINPHERTENMLTRLGMTDQEQAIDLVRKVTGFAVSNREIQELFKAQEKEA